MSEILPSPQVTAAGVDSRPVKAALDSVSVSAVQPTLKAAERFESEDRSPPDQLLRDPLEALGENLAKLLGDNPLDLRLQIDVDEEAGRFVYRSINKETGEVVRQFPSDELLRIIKGVRESAGLAVDINI